MTRTLMRGLGDNNPPGSPPTELVSIEDLSIDTDILAERAHVLIVNADEGAEIVDNETAGKATLLLAMMIEHLDQVEKARVHRKAPFLEAAQTVDRHFHTITLPLAGPNPKTKLEGSAGDLKARLDSYRRQKDAEAVAERRRLEAEAEAQRRAAEAARQAQQAAEEKARRDKEEAARKLEEAQHAATQARTREEQANARAREAEARRAQEAAEAQAKQAQLEAQQAEAKAQDEAARLSAQAAAAGIARPIDSGFGPKATGRLDVIVEITNLQDAVLYCMSNGYEKVILATVQTIYDRLARGKNGARALSGATITEGSKTAIRRK